MNKTEIIILKIVKNLKNQAIVTGLSPDFGVISFKIFGYNSYKNSYSSELKLTNICSISLESGKSKFGKEVENYKLSEISKFKEYKEIISNYSYFRLLMNMYKLVFSLKTELEKSSSAYFLFNLLKKFQENLKYFKKKELYLVEYYFYYYLCFSIGYSIPELRCKNICCIKNSQQVINLNYLTMDLDCADYKSGLNADLKKENYLIAKKSIFILNNFRHLKFSDLIKTSFKSKQLKEDYSEIKNFFRRYLMFHLNKEIL